MTSYRRHLAELNQEALLDEFMNIVGQDRSLRDDLFQKVRFASEAMSYAIADYTIEMWGSAQMEEYLRTLNSRCEWLADNPLAGHERNDVYPGYRSFPEGSHIIFYILSDDYVDTIGIPHKSMDIGPDLF